MYRNLPILSLLFSIVASSLSPLYAQVVFCDASQQAIAARCIKDRKDLFPPLDAGEIARRQKIALPNNNGLEESVYTLTIEAIKKAGTEFIPVDLRYYKSVDWGNMIYGNIADSELRSFTKDSKFHQEIFILFNANNTNVQIIPGKDLDNLTPSVIDRSDLGNAEWVFNMNDAARASANTKFSVNLEYSVLAENIPQISFDVREASSRQAFFGGRWKMHVYSVRNSVVVHGKDTNGIIDFVDNTGLVIKSIAKFKNIEVGCYTDPHAGVFSK